MSAFDQSRRSIGRERYLTLAAELYDLSQNTDPEYITLPEKIVFRGATIGKDRAANEAVRILDQLARPAMWAVNHRAARSIGGSDEPVDLHAYERRGVEILNDFGQFAVEDPRQARAVFVSILEPFGDLHRAGFLFAVLDSLRALDFGEVMPLFRAAMASRKGRYTAMKMRLEAVQIVHFLVEDKLFLIEEGAEPSAVEARKRVGKAFGTTDSTVLSWETRELPSVMPDWQLANAIAVAELAGKTSRLIRTGQENNLSYETMVALAFHSKATRLDALGKEWRERVRQTHAPSASKRR